MPSAIPPFPDGLPETHLHRIALSKILSHDPTTESTLLQVCKDQGFFYLDLTETPRGKALLEAANSLEEVASEAFKLPDSAKTAIGLDKTASIFGWKANGAIAKDDPHKRSDVGQFFNVSKDDVLQNEGCKNVAYPSPIKEEIQSGLFKRFMTDAHTTGLEILNILAKQIGIAEDTMTTKHRLSGQSGDHVRLTWGPGDLNATDAMCKDEANTRITTYEHTDFGSITMLFNWLGGLQIQNGQDGKWEWVRPVPGHAIINLGDAMKEFSGRTLASGKHRVVAAPGTQAKLERYSVVYFVRPEDEVVMESLLPNATSNGANGHTKKWKAGEWIIMRAKGLGNAITDKD